MVAVPAATPETMPVPEATVAIPAEPGALQVPPEVASVKVIVWPMQTAVGPEIADKALTLTAIVALQVDAPEV
jgi:hypothetical protein